MRTCFVLLPFREAFDRYYDQIIAPAVAATGLTAMRGDSLFRPSPIMDDVWQMIRDSEFIVAELTSQNANVFYELGLAHAVGKPVILMSETVEDVPFDLRSLRVITYDRQDPQWGERVRQRLIDSIEQTLADPAHAIPSIFRPDVSRGEHVSSPQDHDDPNFKDRVKLLYERLIEKSYSPDLIVGVSRGGLVVAFYLAKCIASPPLVPVISLWPDPGFENRFNQIAMERRDVPSEAGRARILIVDDISRSGRTLEDARTYLARHVDPNSFEIKTAAISYYRGLYPRSTPPTFHVDEPLGEIRDLAGEVEPVIEQPD